MADTFYPQFHHLVTATNAGLFPVQITSMPAITVTGADGSILDGSDTSIKATVVSYANANVVAVRLSDTNGNYIAPGAASNVTVSNLASVPLTVSGTTIAITSLPDLGLNSSVKITSLPSLAFGQTVTITNGAIVSVSNGTIVSVSDGTTVKIGINSNYWSFTSTYTTAQTNSVLVALPGSTTAICLTDFIVANENTAGNVSFIESRSNAVVRPIVERLYLSTNAGVVKRLGIPIVLDTNSALCFTSRTVTNHSVTVVGYKI